MRRKHRRPLLLWISRMCCKSPCMYAYDVHVLVVRIWLLYAYNNIIYIIYYSIQLIPVVPSVCTVIKHEKKIMINTTHRIHFYNLFFYFFKIFINNKNFIKYYNYKKKKKFYKMSDLFF